MKRSVLQKLAIYSNIDCSKLETVIEPLPEIIDDSLKSVLDEIFSVDPNSGFPRGDIAYFLSKDGNPQVKAWLETNLLSPRAKLNGSSIEGVTDDFIAEFARNDGESAQDYQSRLMSYYDSAKAESERLKSQPKNE